MTSTQRYQPTTSRTASFGAALAINGAVIAGMIYAAPNILTHPKPPTIETYNVPETVPPPPVDLPKPLPDTKPKPSQHPLVVAPKPIVESRSDVTLATQPDIPPVPPRPVDMGSVGTTTVVADPPRPVPPALVPAARDGRFARDFQPDYPSAEIRAGRDGTVTVRVLIGADGRVKTVEQVRATSPAFFDATRRQALARWRFKPATRGGIAEQSWMTLSVRFTLEDR